MKSRCDAPKNKKVMDRPGVCFCGGGGGVRAVMDG
jgi:hypothetical protein